MNEELELSRQRQLESIKQIEQHFNPQQQELPDLMYIKEENKALDIRSKEILKQDVASGVEEYAMGVELKTLKTPFNVPEDKFAGLSSTNKRKVRSAREESLKNASSAGYVNATADTLLLQKELAQFAAKNQEDKIKNSVDINNELNNAGVPVARVRNLSPDTELSKTANMFRESYSKDRKTSVDIVGIKKKIIVWEEILRRHEAGSFIPTPKQQLEIERLKSICRCAKTAYRAELELNGINAETDELAVAQLKKRGLDLHELKEKRDDAVIAYQKAFIYDEKELGVLDQLKVDAYTNTAEFKEKIEAKRAEVVDTDHQNHPEQVNLNFSISGSDTASDFKKLKTRLESNPENYQKYKVVIDAEYQNVLELLAKIQNEDLKLRILREQAEGNDKQKSDEADEIIGIMGDLNTKIEANTLVGRSMGIIRHLLNGGTSDVSGLAAAEIERLYGIVTPFRQKQKQSHDVESEQQEGFEAFMFKSRQASKELLASYLKVKGMPGADTAEKIYNTLSRIADSFYRNIPSSIDECTDYLKSIQDNYAGLQAQCSELCSLDTKNEIVIQMQRQAAHIMELAKNESRVLSSRSAEMIARAVKDGNIRGMQLLLDLRSVEIPVTREELAAQDGGQMSEVFRLSEEGTFFKAESTVQNAMNYAKDFKKNHGEADGAAFEKIAAVLLKKPYDKVITLRNGQQMTRAVNDSDTMSSVLTCVAAYKRHMLEKDQRRIDDDLNTLSDFSTFLAASGLTVQDLTDVNGSVYKHIEEFSKFQDMASVKLNTAKIPLDAGMNCRDVATYRLASLLGRGELVTAAVSAKLTEGGELLKKGISMETAKGEDYNPMVTRRVVENGEEVEKSLPTVLTTKSMLQLADLNVLDNLCGQIDRHGHNYKVKYAEKDCKWAMESIQGIDNDLSFGLLNGQDVMDRVSNTMGLADLRLITRELFINVTEVLTDDVLKYSFADLLSEAEIGALLDRFHVIRGKLIEMAENGTLHLADNNPDEDGEQAQAIKQSFRAMSRNIRNTVSPESIP